MYIKKAPRSLKAPQWWGKVLSLVPDIRLSFMNLYIKKNKTLRGIVNSIPAQCPFEKGYYLVVGDHQLLIYYVPALCKLNPFFNWLIDLKIEVFEQERFEREEKHHASLHSS